MTKTNSSEQVSHAAELSDDDLDRVSAGMTRVHSSRDTREPTTATKKNGLMWDTDVGSCVSG